MTPNIKRAASILRNLTDKEDLESHGILLTKEAESDYIFFIRQLQGLIGNVSGLTQSLTNEYNKIMSERQGTVCNCSTHRCDLCKNLCDKHDDDTIDGCFMYHDGHKMYYSLK